MRSSSHHPGELSNVGNLINQRPRCKRRIAHLATDGFGRSPASRESKKKRTRIRSDRRLARSADVDPLQTWLSVAFANLLQSAALMANLAERSPASRTMSDRASFLRARAKLIELRQHARTTPANRGKLLLGRYCRHCIGWTGHAPSGADRGQSSFPRSTTLLPCQRVVSYASCAKARASSNR
jgi:hypothetical protein